MQDLTQGPVTGHLLRMGAFLGIGLVFQTLYFLVDLYFVARLGDTAVAGVSSAGTTFYLVFALTQMVSVGAMALISHAAGARDAPRASHFFNQSLSLSLGMAALTCALGYGFGNHAVGLVAADEATLEQGVSYLYAFLPSLALMFPTATLGSSLRSVGVVAPTMLIQTGSILLNAALAPVLIAGWGTGVPLGVAGAGWASTIAGAVGFLATMQVFHRVQSTLHVKADALVPVLGSWRRITVIGLPAAAEMALMFILTSVIYWITARFGAHAQAGFGIGGRVMQAFFLPAMAISFAAGPIIGQNFGAGRYDRVRATFGSATLIGSSLMLTLSLLCMWHPEIFIHIFTRDPEVADVANSYLRILSWNFVAAGLAFTCSSLFQGLGNTLPSLAASASRVITYVIPAVWWSTQPQAQLEHFWYLSVASTCLQGLMAVALALRLMKIKLAVPPAAAI